MFLVSRFYVSASHARASAKSLRIFVRHPKSIRLASTHRTDHIFTIILIFIKIHNNLHFPGISSDGISILPNMKCIACLSSLRTIISTSRSYTLYGLFHVHQENGFYTNPCKHIATKSRHGPLYIVWNSIGLLLTCSCWFRWRISALHLLQPILAPFRPSLVCSRRGLPNVKCNYFLPFGCLMHRMITQCTEWLLNGIW
jgi:hypothetical protein